VKILKLSRRACAWVIAALTVASFPGAAAQEKDKPAPVNITGKWTMTLELEAFTATPTLEFKQDGEKVTGTYTSARYGTFPFQGKIKDRALEFTVKMSAEGSDVELSFSGDVAADGQTMKGKGSLSGVGDATWNARKEKS
jgi:hypothetical protein